MCENEFLLFCQFFYNGRKEIGWLGGECIVSEKL